MKRIILITLSAIGLILLLVGGGAFYAFRQLTQSPWTTNEVWIYVHQHDPQETILEQLKTSGGDTESSLFKLGMHIWDPNKKTFANRGGAFHLQKGMSIAQVLRKLSRHQQDPIKLTFIGTRTIPELAGKIADGIEADSISILNAMYDPEFLNECGCDSANLAGFLLPDTYEIYWNITPKKLMQRLLNEYHRYWNDERIAKAQSLKVSPQQISILCSIAEEETANREERGVVARLYWNRLQMGMKLQADPTVKYAVGDFSLRRILNVHLSVVSPYNTYLNEGLPPGPIRVVEKATIDAFLNSQPHKYIYMCAKEDFSGLHNFATSLAAHQKNAKLYHQALSKKGIR